MSKRMGQEDYGHTENLENSSLVADLMRLELYPGFRMTLLKKRIRYTTPIQGAAFPLISDSKDVVVRDKSDPGRRFVYLLSLLNQLWRCNQSRLNSSLGQFVSSTMIIVPTEALREEVFKMSKLWIEAFSLKIEVAELTSTIAFPTTDIFVSTPGSLLSWLESGLPQVVDFVKSLCVLIFDEADELLRLGFEENLKSLVTRVPNYCQCLVFSSDQSTDLGRLINLAKHNPHILTLTEGGAVTVGVFPCNVEQFYFSCSEEDKLDYALTLLGKHCFRRGVLVFTNSNDRSRNLKLSLEKLELNLKVAVFSELAGDTRTQILEAFNSGSLNYLLIATDDNQSAAEISIPPELAEESRAQYLEEFNASLMAMDGNQSAAELRKKAKKHLDRKLDADLDDLKNLLTPDAVVNFDLPPTFDRYIRRISLAGRPDRIGQSVSLVSPAEMDFFNRIKSAMGDSIESTKIAEYGSAFGFCEKAMKAFLYPSPDHCCFW